MSNILSIEPYLYQGNTITEILNLYVAALRQDSSETSPVVAAKLQEVLAMISDTDFLSEIRIILKSSTRKSAKPLQICVSFWKVDVSLCSAQSPKSRRFWSLTVRWITFKTSMVFV